MDQVTAPPTTTPTPEQLRAAERIGYAIGAKLDHLTFASVDEVAAGQYPLDSTLDNAVLEAFYDGIRGAVRARQAVSS